MLICRSRFLTGGEVWFDTEPDDSPVDWILYLQRSRPVPGTRSVASLNLMIVLSQPVEQLRAQIRNSAASEIRRAQERDGITCERCDPRDPAILDQFEKVYNRFVAHKKALPLNRARINRMAARAF